MDSASSLPTQYQQFIHLSRYARWDEEKEKRETWDHTVSRYFDFFVPYLNEHQSAEITQDEVNELFGMIHRLEIMPSMRALMTAGPALARDHVAGYNCSYRPINHIRAFDEIMFILMCAAGVGFSVERQFINQLPSVPNVLDESTLVITVRDSKRGWAEGYRELLALLYAGRIPGVDYSLIRPAGARLKTMGGRASGPDPLEELIDFTIHTFKTAAGRKLTSIECHDMVCKIGECVVVGGVRRSALISLSNLSDNRMREAKSGEWWTLTPYRALANNSVAYTERPEVGQYMQEWLALYNSKSGERGLFNREAAIRKVVGLARRASQFGEGSMARDIDFGTNPCGEIILRPNQFCNLSTCIIRPDDDEAVLMNKVRAATILGTWQSCLTNFRYIDKTWQDNCEEERLLGVSMTGIMSSPLLNGTKNLKQVGELLEYLKNEIAIKTNQEWAERLGINPAAAITCVKPEGTVTQLTNAHCSGIHPAYSRWYIRRVRQDIKDPLTTMMIDQGVPHEVDTMNAENIVFSFPHEVDKNCVFRDDMSAINQLNHWKVFNDSWCEHNPSVTIYVRENEWPEVGGWVYNNFDGAGGLTFLPHSDHVYKQAPYEEIDNVNFLELSDQMPEIDWALLSEYEKEDSTTVSHDIACAGGMCEI